MGILLNKTYLLFPECTSQNVIIVIIGCSELFIEIPSNLDVAAMCWSSYKNHYTVKYLVGITPNGNISFLSDTYGERKRERKKEIERDRKREIERERGGERERERKRERERERE